MGLPARGKSYIVKKLRRYLNWLQYETKVCIFLRHDSVQHASTDTLVGFQCGQSPSSQPSVTESSSVSKVLWPRQQWNEELSWSFGTWSIGESIGLAQRWRTSSYSWCNQFYHWKKVSLLSPSLAFVWHMNLAIRYRYLLLNRLRDFPHIKVLILESECNDTKVTWMKGWGEEEKDGRKSMMVYCVTKIENSWRGFDIIDLGTQLSTQATWPRLQG